MLRSWRKRQVAFGLVRFEIALKPLTGGEDDHVSGNRVDRETMTQVKQAWLKDDGTLSTDVVTAFRTEAGYVTVDESKIKVAGSDTIDLTACCPVDSIDPIYYEKSYLVWPTKGSEEAFDLFVTTLRDSNRAAVGKVVLGKNTRMIVLRWSPATKCLVAHTCAYEANIRFEDISMVTEAASARPAPSAAYLEIAAKLVASLDGTFDTTGVVDDFQAALKLAVEAAKAGTEYTPAPVAASPKVDDLLAQLEASVTKEN